jgi:hypothetical protein
MAAKVDNKNVTGAVHVKISVPSMPFTIENGKLRSVMIVLNAERV